MMTQTLQTIFDNYQALCLYCDAFFDAMQKTYTKQIHCIKGCSTCCELSSVCALEARMIISLSGTIASISTSHKPFCVLLQNNNCSIYKNRPIICRSHGLILTNENRKTCSSCPLNFSSQTISNIPITHIFDTAKISDNLMRLNLAFCIAINDKDLAHKRFMLSDVRTGNVPKHIFEL
jgi:Fe-S-cluster containining protein